MPNISNISVATVHEPFVQAKCNFFTDVALWPRKERLNPNRWLRNFASDEQTHAIHLLNAFTYFCNDLVNELFRSAFQRLSSFIVSGVNSVDRQAEWDAFRDEVVITPVMGESPSAADSGYAFTRLARQQLEIQESQLLGAEHALELLRTRPPRWMVFVDDFVGSGSQFASTWNRQINVGGILTSFKNAAASAAGSTSFFYCPLVCTEYGVSNLEPICPEVNILPVHLLSSRYSALAPDSVVWPDSLRPTARDFIHTTSRRAGIRDELIEGFHNLGLAIGFEHCIPDATLPLFYHESTNWNPLVRRT